MLFLKAPSGAFSVEGLVVFAFENFEGAAADSLLRDSMGAF